MRGAMRLAALCVVALLALTAPARANDDPYGDAAQWADIEEWHTALLKAHTLEPEGAWLKTCSGWTAQEVCSTVFGSGLSEETAYNEDIGYLPRLAADYYINYAERSVTAWCLFDNPQNQTYKSIHRENLGCTLVERLTEAEIRATDVGDQTPPPPLDPNVAWPEGEGFFPDQAPDGIDLECVARVSAEQFSQPIPNPRAIVVVYKGALVFEQYAPGVTKNNRLLGWSATKSLTQALVGILVGDGRLNIYEPADVPEWREDPNDARQNITVDMMLRMSSGTKWVGDIVPTTECIFWSDANCAHVCALKPLVAEPDTLWNYNSGSSYLLSRLVLEKRGDRHLTNYEWPKHRLFYPIGAHSMYIEYQPNDDFLGGAYGYGTARDWARFGLLFLRNGVWIDGRRILPAGWVEYSSTPTHTNDGYAAHFWRSPDVDPKLFFASGFRNQNVYIFPDQELVIARFAMPPLAGHPVWRQSDFLNGMLSCLTDKRGGK